MLYSCRAYALRPLGLARFWTAALRAAYHRRARPAGCRAGAKAL